METLTFTQTVDGLQNTQTETWTFKRGIGYAPVQALVSATAVCESYVYQEILTNSHIPFTFVSTDASYERDEATTAQPVKDIQVTFHIKDVPAAKQKLATRALHLVAANCPVTQSLNPNLKVSETVIFED